MPNATETEPTDKAEVKRLREQIATLQADAERRDAEDASPLVYTSKAAGTGHLEDRLARVTAHVSRIPKRGFNKEQKYQFVAHSDVLDAIRPALAAEGVQFRSEIIGGTCEPELKIDGSPRTTGGGMIWRMWIVNVRFTFSCRLADTRCEQTTEWRGYAQDYSDKGESKALTAAIKTFLIQQFLVSTGDDPDEPTTDPQPAQAQGGQGYVRQPSNGAPASGDLRAARNAALDFNAKLPQGVLSKIARKVAGNGIILKIEDVQALKKIATAAARYEANPEGGEAWLNGDPQAASGEPAPEDTERQEAAAAPDVPAVPAVVAPYDGLPLDAYDPPLTDDERRQYDVGINPRPDTDGDDTPF